jgi:hypothetical protein
MPLKSQDYRVCRDLQTARTSAFVASLTRLQSNRRGSVLPPAGQERPIPSSFRLSSRFDAEFVFGRKQ